MPISNYQTNNKMKYITVYLGEHKIELFNTFLGKETVKVNGEIVSSKYSMAGTEHLFSINEKEGKSDYKLNTGVGFRGVIIDLYKN